MDTWRIDTSQELHGGLPALQAGRLFIELPRECIDTIAQAHNEAVAEAEVAATAAEKKEHAGELEWWEAEVDSLVEEVGDLKREVSELKEELDKLRAEAPEDGKEKS